MSIDCTTVHDVGEQSNSSRYTRTNRFVFARILGANALPSLRRTTTMFPAPKGEGVSIIAVAVGVVGEPQLELEVDMECFGDAVYEGEPDEDRDNAPLELAEGNAAVASALLDCVPEAEPEPTMPRVNTKANKIRRYI